MTEKKNEEKQPKDDGKSQNEKLQEQRNPLKGEPERDPATLR